MIPALSAFVSPHVQRKVPYLACCLAVLQTCQRIPRSDHLRSSRFYHCIWPKACKAISDSRGNKGTHKGIKDLRRLLFRYFTALHRLHNSPHTTTKYTINGIVWSWYVIKKHLDKIC